jgi:hypothetical protein
MLPMLSRARAPSGWRSQATHAVPGLDTASQSSTGAARTPLIRSQQTIEPSPAAADTLIKVFSDVTSACLPCPMRS